jgi:hypothetical protein
MIKIKKQLYKLFSETLQEGTNELGEKYQAIQLIDFLKEIYPTQLKDEIVSVRMYQTEKGCYLETTEVANPETPEIVDLEEWGIDGSYWGKDYKSFRRSVGFITRYDNELLFIPSKSVHENAYSFMVEMDDISRLNTTDIFSEKGAVEIRNKAVPEESETTDEAGYNYGENVYSPETLAQMDGYASYEDEDALLTPCCKWTIDEGICVIKFTEDQEHTRNDPFSELTRLPDVTEFAFSICCGIREWKITIPLDNIKQISLKSAIPAFADYENLGDYRFTIDLTGGHRMVIQVNLNRKYQIIGIMSTRYQFKPGSDCCWVPLPLFQILIFTQYIE